MVLQDASRAQEEAKMDLLYPHHRECAAEIKSIEKLLGNGGAASSLIILNIGCNGDQPSPITLRQFVRMEQDRSGIQTA